MIQILSSEANNAKRDVADYLTVKAWFQQCRDGAAAVEAQRQKIKRLRELAEKTTPSMTGMPCASGEGDKIGTAACDIVDEECKLVAMKQNLNMLRREAVKRIYEYATKGNKCTSKIPDYMGKYYIDCAGKDKKGNFKLKTYEMVAAELGVDESTVKKSIKNVLKKAALNKKDFDYSTQIPL